MGSGVIPCYRAIWILEIAVKSIAVALLSVLTPVVELVARLNGIAAERYLVFTVYVENGVGINDSLFPFLL